MKMIASGLEHRGRKSLGSLAALLACLTFAPMSSAQDQVVTLAITRPPVAGTMAPTQSFIVTTPAVVAPAPTAVVILLTGGTGSISLTSAGSNGTLGINSSNFVVRDRWLFAGHGFYTITLDSATDFQLLPNGLKGQQGSTAHITDILQVIAWARATVPGLPVWVVGTSRGTAGAFVAAAYNPASGGPDGLVFSSPVNDTGDPDSLLSANLAAITVPVLLVGDAGNACPGTLAADDATVKKMLTSSPKVENETLPSGGLIALTDACNPLSDHGFFGLEDKAVRKMALFIETY